MSAGAREEQRAFEPANMSSASLSTKREVWYKRPWVLVMAAIVIVVAASVLSDLPQPVSRADDISSQTASIKEINQDLGPCAYAIKETFLIAQAQQTGTLTAADRAQAPTMLKNDQTACSFTSSSIFDLTNNIQIQDTAAGKRIDRMLSVVTIWSTSDALAAVEDIQALYVDPTNAPRRADLAKRERLLAKDRAEAFSDVAAADALLNTQLDMPRLPALPSGS